MVSARLFGWLVGLVCWAWSAGPLAESVDEYQLKAAYIYKFAVFAEWPSQTGNEFRFCLLGRNDFGPSLDGLANKRIHSLPGRVALLVQVEGAKACQVVFLNPGSRSELKRWLAELAEWPVLTISDHVDGFEEGVMIALNVEPNRIGFRINIGLARQRGISLPAQVLKLADEVR